MSKLEGPDSQSSEVTRRVMLRGAAVSGVALPLLAACGSDADESGGSSPSAAESSDGGGNGGNGGGGDGLTVASSDVPVGGGTILKADEVVVTQPTDGEFMAFTAICTHQGCVVSSVADGNIVCACHGSTFSIEDGSVVTGPATAPLEAKTVSVKGDEISIT